MSAAPAVPATMGWYPYPFIDVAELGYGTALLNALLVTVLMLVVGTAYLGADRLLARRRR